MSNCIWIVGNINFELRAGNIAVHKRPTTEFNDYFTRVIVYAFDYCCCNMLTSSITPLHGGFMRWRILLLYFIHYYYNAKFRMVPRTCVWYVRKLQTIYSNISFPVQCNKFRNDMSMDVMMRCVLCFYSINTRLYHIICRTLLTANRTPRRAIKLKYAKIIIIRINLLYYFTHVARKFPTNKLYFVLTFGVCIRHSPVFYMRWNFSQNNEILNFMINWSTTW